LNSRRDFLQLITSGALSVAAPMVWAAPETKQAYKPIILIELKGANDGLNTWIPTSDATYYAARPTIAIKAAEALRVTSEFSLHPALQGFKTLWDEQHLAVIQGVGYPQPVLSHFRSTDIWDTGSASNEVIGTGWLTRAFIANALGQAYSADFVSIGSNEAGPGQGGARAINLAAAQSFVNQARLAKSNELLLPGALNHIAKVDRDIVNIAMNIDSKITFNTEFTGSLAASVRAAATVLASRAAPVVRITQGGYDTHRNQLGAHASLMSNLSQAIMQLKSALLEHGVWQDAMVLTYSEFGRRVKENASNGTDHGTANVMFATGGRVKAGVYGIAPSLQQLDNGGNLSHTVDFRAVYSQVLQSHWGFSAAQTKAVFGTSIDPSKYPPLAFVQTVLALK
jgi:uncharacterized protein (DUF1501 family)